MTSKLLLILVLLMAGCCSVPKCPSCVATYYPQNVVICGGGYTDKNNITWNWQGYAYSEKDTETLCCYYPFLNGGWDKEKLEPPIKEKMCNGAELEYKRLLKIIEAQQ